jgi:hypothetical protein
MLLWRTPPDEPRDSQVLAGACLRQNRESQSAPLALIGGAQEEPLKAYGEASGDDRRGRLRSRLSLLIDVKFSVI